MCCVMFMLYVYVYVLCVMCYALCVMLICFMFFFCSVLLYKVRALTQKAYLDDTDMEEEGIAEILMDDNAMAKAPR